MVKHVDKIADALGAQVIGQVPDTGAGAFGMARLAAVLRNLVKGNGPDGPVIRHGKFSAKSQ